MKIEQIHIDGFGHFANQSFGPFDRPLTVVLGSNEAGKTTLLAFIRTVLFGFPLRERARHYPPLNGGRHGGRIIAMADNGVRYTVERTEDSNGPALKVTTSSGLLGTDESMLRPLIGDSPRGVFESIFAFGLDDLQDIKRLNESDASAQIYAAGMGASSLPRALKRFKDDADKLFGARLQTQTAARLVNDIKGLDEKLDAARGNSAEYAALTHRRAELEAELESANSRLTAASGGLAELDRFKRAWDDWVALNEAQAALSDLPAQPGFPGDALARLDKAETAVEGSTRALQEASDQFERDSARANAPIPGESLLPLGSRIEEIRRGRDSFDASVKDLPKREAELSGDERSLAETLTGLGPGWTEQRVLDFDTSIPSHDPIEQWRTQLDDAGRAMSEAGLARDRADEAARDGAESAECARSELEALPQPALSGPRLDTSRTALRASRQALDAYLRASDRLADAETQAAQAPPPAPAVLATPNSPVPVLVLMGAGAVAVIGGVVLGGSGLVLGIALGLLLVGAGAFLRFGGRAASPSAAAATPVPLSYSQPHLVQLRALESAARAALESAAAPFGRGLPGEAALDAIESSLDATETALRNIEVAQKQWQRLRDEHERLATRADEAAATLAGAEQTLAATTTGWAAWLTARNLTPTLRPGTVLALYARIDTAKTKIHAIREPRERPVKIAHDIERYASLVGPLARDYGIAIETGRSQTIASAADRLIRDYDSAHNASIRRENVRESLKEQSDAVDRLTARDTAARQALQQLLALGKAGDAECFRRNAQNHALRVAAEAQLSDAEAHIRRICGPGEQYNAFLATLGRTSLVTLDLDRSRLGLESEAAQSEREQLLDERGQLTHRLDQLAGDERTSELRADREVLVEQLRECARRWSTLTLARNLLLRAQRKYEAERQPEVLRNAQDYFSTMTNGRYTRLISPLGKQTITAETANGISKEPAQLSRGTEDQLYLALRFGLVRQFGEREANLPVVVDDILVNFDPDRALRAAQAFAQLSRTNQVVVFTCQPATYELFRRADPRVQLIDLTPRRAPTTPALTPVATTPLLAAALPH